jgi:hypothetical protein
MKLPRFAAGPQCRTDLSRARARKLEEHRREMLDAGDMKNIEGPLSLVRTGERCRFSAASGLVAIPAAPDAFQASLWRVDPRVIVRPCGRWGRSHSTASRTSSIPRAADDLERDGMAYAKRQRTSRRGDNLSSRAVPRAADHEQISVTVSVLVCVGRPLLNAL